MHATLKDTFCKDPGNYTKDPGGGTCLERDSGKTIAEAYCKVGNRIKSDGACTSKNLGNFYTKLAEAYCKTSAGRTDSWCSCYNVMNKVCDTNKSAAGCLDKVTSFDALKNATPDKYKSMWDGRETCFGGVCKGAKYIPSNANQGCDAPIEICENTINARDITKSNILLKCGDKGGDDDDDDDGDDDEDAMYEPGSISDKLNKNFRSKLPKSIQTFIPVSVKDVQKDSKKLVGLGGPLLSIFCFLLIIILLISMTGGKKRRYLR
jgi:hypothetical protein